MKPQKAVMLLLLLAPSASHETVEQAHEVAAWEDLLFKTTEIGAQKMQIKEELCSFFSLNYSFNHTGFPSSWCENVTRDLSAFDTI